MNVKIYVDDIFFWHSNLRFNKNINSIFTFFKFGSFNSNIIDNLAYHHFYLWTGIYDFKIKHIQKKSNCDSYKMGFEITLEDGRKGSFFYNILCEKYQHSIEHDSKKIQINSEKYPLKKMLHSVFKGSADYKGNKKRTLNALKLCEAVKSKLQKNILVVGGGIFGSTASMVLAHSGYNVTLHEELGETMECASNINQYRLHKGYHYPRSQMTARECLDGLESFKRKYEDSLVDNNIEHFYSIAKEGSLVSGDQYLAFVKQMKLPFDVVKANKGTELTIKVDEILFDSFNLKKQVLSKIKSSGVNLILNKRSTKKDFKSFDYVVIATYAKINELLDKKRPYQYEIIEKPVVRLPESYANKSIVVMDGPFMCLDPFRDGLHVMGHVKHAIHSTFINERPNGLDKNIIKYLNNGIIINPIITNIEKFKKAGLQFFDDFNKLEHIGSMFTVRTVLANRDHDDARPTIVNKEGGNIFTIFSGKIGTCVESAYRLVEMIKGPAPIKK